MAKREKTYKRGRFGRDASVKVTVCEEQSCAYGKVVDLFHWDSKDGKAAYEVPIRLVKETGRKEDGFEEIPPLRKVYFGVWIEKPIRFGYLCENIEILRQAVFTALDEGTAIDWKPMFLVKVKRPYAARYEGGAGVEFTYDTIYLGKTLDGADVWKEESHRTEMIYEGHPKLGVVTKHYRGEEVGTLITMVDATKENAAALEVFEGRFDALRKSLCAFLAPDKVQGTLNRINDMTMALQAPEEGKKK
jgi:hypothetical protein